MENLEQKAAAWIVRHRWWFLLLLPIIVLATAIGLKNLEFVGNYRVFFSEDNPQLQAFDKLENTYSQDDNVIFLLVPKDGQIFSRETLIALEELTEMAWQIPYSLRVDSLTNFQYTEARGDELIVRDLVRNAKDLSDAEIARIRHIALTEPLLVEKVIPKSAAITIVNVTVQLPRVDEMQEVPKVVTATCQIADEIRARYPKLDVRLTGMVVMNNAFSEVAKGDMGFLTLISFGVMLIALALLLRRALGTLATLLIIFIRTYALTLLEN